MSFIKNLWDFSRPHTIIGSWISITALYALAIVVAFNQDAVTQLWTYFPQYLLTLGSALCCNIYITGLNQVQDVDLDKINKPWLPIASGALSMKTAKVVVLITGFIAIVLAAIANYYLLAIIILIMAIGTAYSLPPLKFKKHHILAALSILLVRGILVNVGITAQFMYTIEQKFWIPAVVWPITLFVIGFSMGIAWFKDIPDTKGDSVFKIKTLAVIISAQAAFRWGVAAVAFSYIGIMLLAAFFPLALHQPFFYTSHSLLLGIFLVGASRVRLADASQIKKFYLIFWTFFFLEYIIYPLSFYLY